MIAALGRFKDPAAVQPLLGTLKAPQPAVRAAAVDALVAIVEAEDRPRAVAVVDAESARAHGVRADVVGRSARADRSATRAIAARGARSRTARRSPRS